MQTTVLGRTGLTVSVAGLGCGGNSRIGLGRGLARTASVQLVRAAIDLGVNFIDTAEVYGTEEIVGEALASIDRRQVVVSTKSRYARDGECMSGAEIVRNLEDSLRRLRTDYVDIFHVHGVKPGDYDRVCAEILPSLLAARDSGKVRHLGITESPPNDPSQAMLSRAVEDDVWDVVMLALHMMNQGACERVLPATRTKGIGTLVMFAVRNIFSRPEQLRQTLTALAQAGQIPARFADADEPLALMVPSGAASNLFDAAYRFARHQPGVDVVLFGTGNVDHLQSNIASIQAPPLPDADVDLIRALFGKLAGVGLDLPDHVQPAGGG